MIEFSKGNIHDIDHFIRVWTYAKTIGEMERLDTETQYVLEADTIHLLFAAITSCHSQPGRKGPDGTPSSGAQGLPAWHLQGF